MERSWRARMGCVAFAHCQTWGFCGDQTWISKRSLGHFWPTGPTGKEFQAISATSSESLVKTALFSKKGRWTPRGIDPGSLCSDGTEEEVSLLDFSSATRHVLDEFIHFPALTRGHYVSVKSVQDEASLFENTFWGGHYLFYGMTWYQISHGAAMKCSSLILISFAFWICIPNKKQQHWLFGLATIHCWPTTVCFYYCIQHTLFDFKPNVLYAFLDSLQSTNVSWQNQIEIPWYSTACVKGPQQHSIHCRNSGSLQWCPCT